MGTYKVAEGVDAILFVGLLPEWYPPNYDCGAERILIEYRRRVPPGRRLDRRHLPVD